MGNLTFRPTPLAGLLEVECPEASDGRGRFSRLYDERTFASQLPGFRVAQANISTTLGQGTLRGLHYQGRPASDAKVVRCIAGRVFDVAVDLRRDSPTLMQWHAVELAYDRPRALLIPAGFAHGFQVLSDAATLVYLHGAPWTPDCEGGVRHDDPRLGIAWPLPPARLSARDLALPLLDRDFAGIDP